MKKDKMAIDMVNGPFVKKILIFSIPLIASNILQIMFNIVDTIIVGRFAGYNSLAAVGSTNSIQALFVNSFIGASVGVNVVVAKYIGLGRKQRDITEAVHTAVAVAAIGGAVMALLGIMASGLMVKIVDIPEDIRSLSLLYIRICFLGTIFNMIYNFCAAILRATGDTRRPLIYLSVSGIINVILNLFFVIVLHMDVAGVALATVISHGISAFMIMYFLIHTETQIRFSWKYLCINSRILREMAGIGIPSWIQSILFSVSNMAIQSAINAYDSIVIAGCSAATSIESVLFLSMNAFSQAEQTFVSQNFGAERIDNIKKVTKLCLMFVITVGVLQSLVTVIFSRSLISIYNSNLEVIEAGIHRLFIVASVYWFYGICDVLMSAIRGCGEAVAPMIINLICSCLLRFLWVLIVDTDVMDVGAVYLSYPGTWLALMMVLIPFWDKMIKKIEQKNS